MKKRLFLLMAATWALFMVLAASAYAEVYVSDLAGLEAQLNADGTLKDDVTVTQTITINKPVTLDLAGHSITTYSGNANLFEINSGGRLTLKDGQNSGAISGGRIKVGDGNGTFEMLGGTITGCNATVGGGVYVDVNGTFNMKGGTISNNTVDGDGGGVYVNGGTFEMSGGTISGNTADNNGGGVYVGTSGKFTMSGGTIGGETEADKNTASGSGGGVYISGSGITMNMTGGEIKGNSAANGGGVYTTGTLKMSDSAVITNNTASSNGGGVYTGGALEISGNAEISDNTSGSKGGGVYFASGSLSMTGGTISGNIASGDDGGGIYIVDGTSVTVNDGTITGNEAVNGGGIYISIYANVDVTFAGGKITGNKSTGEATNTGNGGGGGVYVGCDEFKITGGEISGNTALYGGGVSIASSKKLTMTGGTISSNSAVNYGGGVYTSNSGTFNMEGGAISGNKATDQGGGVFTLISSNFNMSGGQITSNEASTGGGVSGSGSFDMSGSASVTGNKATSAAGGVYASSSFTVSGNVQVTGNTKDDAPNNVYLLTNRSITVGNVLGASAEIGFTMQTPTVGSVIAQGGSEGTLSAADEAKFVSDDPRYTAKFDGAHNGLVLDEVKGTLKITVEVTGDLPEATADAVVFDLTVTGPADLNGNFNSWQFANGMTSAEVSSGEIEIPDLPAGVYTVSENEANAQVSGHTLMVAGNNATVTLKGGETAEVRITNTYIETNSLQTSGPIVWRIDNNGVLSVWPNAEENATAAIPDFVTENAPWYSKCDQITGVVLANGITGIGVGAFEGINNAGGLYTHLASVSIPESVTKIGDRAFANCTGLTSMVLPEGVTDIGAAAFAGCSKLTNVEFPTTLASIGGGAFKDSGIEVLTFNGGTFVSASSGSGIALEGLDGITIKYPGDDPGWALFALSPELYGASNIVWEAVNGADVAAAIVWSGVPEDKKPAEVLVQLLLGLNSVGDPVVLNAANNWTYVWQNRCVAGYEVKLVNTLPEGFESTIDNSGDVKTITITYTAEDPAANVTLTTPDGSANITSGTVDPTVTISAGIDFGPNAWDLSNYTLTDNGTGLTIASVTLNEDGTITLQLAGTAQPGTFVLTIGAGAFPEGANIGNPPAITVSVNTPSSGGSTGGGGGGGSARTETASPIPELAPSPIQDAALKKELGIIDWIDRVNVPDYAQTLYEVMAGRPGDGVSTAISSVFELEGNFTLRQESVSASEANAGVEYIEIVEFALLDTYAEPGALGVSSTLFEDEKFYKINISEADKQINYSALKLGDVIRTANFNGLFITKIPKGADYEAKKKETCEYIAAVYQAYDRDYPEIFWLNGKCKVRIMTVSNQQGGSDAYFFMVLADNAKFTMRSPAWEAEGSIAAGVQRREAAVSTILGTVTAGDAVGQIKQLNRWLTEHNQYNTTPDLTTIGNEPHECLAALEGRVSQQGPVCDGYSRAFKVLCDRLSIPCVLETGWARATTTSEPEFHMWNAVQVGNSWYSVDVTWNDPSVKGFVGAKSGRESEEFLLVGQDTVIRSQVFRASHVVKNQASVGGIDFNNGPVVSAVAFSALPNSGYYVSLYNDVPMEHWAADAVAWAKSRGLMQGMSDTTFGTNLPITREQVWTILARSSGAAPAGYDEARQWGVSAGLTDGTAPKAAISRQEMVCLLYRLAKQQEQPLAAEAADLAGFRDLSQLAPWAEEAMRWAVAGNIVHGTSSDTISPEAETTRAQFAVILQRFLAGSAND